MTEGTAISGRDGGDWLQADQRVLAAAVEMIRCALTDHLDEGAAGGQARTPPRDALEQARAEDPGSSALDRLVAAFSLSPFERDVLLLCAAVELDGEVARLCGRALGADGRAAPCFSLALAALPDPAWAALLPGSPLRYWQLVTLGPGATVTSAPLRIAEPVLHHLTGSTCLDEQLHGLVEPVGDPGMLPPSQERLAARAAALWQAAGGAWPVLQLCGKDGEDVRAVAAAACRQLGMTLRAVSAADLPADPAGRYRVQRLWEREAVLTDSALYVDAFDADHDRAGGWVAFVQRLQGAVLVGAAEPVPLRGRATSRLDVPPLDSDEQVALWTSVLGDAAGELDCHVERLVAQFQLGARQIEDAGRLVRHRLGGDEQAPAAALVWDTCRTQTRTRLEHLAQRIRPAATMADLVLDAAAKETLAQTAVHVRHRMRVYDRWGFAARSERGLGISALFVGPSGTGKTMAAEVVAGELQLDLYRVDLSAVISKYIGETEKNLARVFDAAEAGGTVLLFDEADAVFGKRSEVRDSHDRYANIEVSYLLQRMEAYRGLAILTTNLKHAIDPAFMRRIRFVVQFPFPGAASREQIWQRVFPAATPVDALDFGRLARLNVTGGSIRNIALSAAFLAADEDSPVGMRHLLHAAQREYTKLERPLTPQEVGGWT